MNIYEVQAIGKFFHVNLCVVAKDITAVDHRAND